MSKSYANNWYSQYLESIKIESRSDEYIKGFNIKNIMPIGSMKNISSEVLIKFIRLEEDRYIIKSCENKMQEICQCKSGKIGNYSDKIVINSFSIEGSDINFIRDGKSIIYEYKKQCSRQNCDLCTDKCSESCSIEIRTKKIHYYENGYLHMEDKPAIIEGKRAVYFLKGKQYRKGGLPTIIYDNKVFFYTNNGLLHGKGYLPGVIDTGTGELQYWKNGLQLYGSTLSKFFERKEMMKKIAKGG